MIRKDNGLSIRRQCELLGLNRSGLYYTPTGPNQAAVRLDESLMERIDHWHTRCPYLSSRKIVAKLQEEGFSVCRKTVRRLMLKMGIYAIYPKPNLSKRNFKESIVPYLLRDYTVSFPNQVWSIDITYIPMPHGSDQGSQFTSDDYKNLLRNLNIRQSMDGRSRWADNIMIERWFRSLKTEQLYPNEYRTPRELRRLINQYVDDYNNIRPHEALGYKVPNEFYFACFAA